jgi:hypothetical protein
MSLGVSHVMMTSGRGGAAAGAGGLSAYARQMHSKMKDKKDKATHERPADGQKPSGHGDKGHAIANSYVGNARAGHICSSLVMNPQDLLLVL